MSLEWRARFAGLPLVQWLAILFVIGLGLFPITLALLRLWAVTGITPLGALTTVHEQPGAVEAFQFSLLEAAASTGITVAIGLPLAWAFGRYQWRNIRLKRALLFLPFVTPPVVAAVGFLALISPGGFLYNLGFDLRGETGFIGWLSSVTGWSHPGHFIALVGAHVWFNLSLMIRFVEPVVAQLDATWEEQLALLPSGQTRRERIQHLWWPVLGPATLVAATYTFFFSFTSFALVKWLAPSSNTLESMLGEMGGTAGIAGYQVETSLAVLSIATFQMLLMLVMLILAGRFERQHSQVLSMHHETKNRERHGPASRRWTFFVNGILVLLLAPLISVVIASFQVRTIGPSGATSQWTVEGWKRAYSGDFSTVPLLDALTNSLSYAVLALFVALPLGYTVATSLVTLRERGHRRLAGVVDSLCMLPLSMSAVMVGLGMVAGILRWFPEMFTFPYLPVIPHVMLVLPFVIRLMVPAIERIDPIYAEQASLLPMRPLAFWWHSRGSFLVVPATMAASLCLAFSMGEFGATFLVVRVGSWDSLSILVDQVASRPKFDPYVFPTAMALATILMLVTLLVLSINERARAWRSRHDV
ncbi:MAG: ABC transporter permease [Poseidonia sp.]